MALLQVEITSSEEMIKPSSPTPLHLKEHKFSILDQIIPPAYTPLIFFYQLDVDSNDADRRRTHITQLLKDSLTKTLTTFYPLAGQIQGNSAVDCNDMGVRFVEARVRARLSDIVAQEYNIGQHRQLLPVLSHDDPNAKVSAVQINFFECGGIAVAICVSHKAADAYSQMGFIQSWAATYRGEPSPFQPRFDLARFFPPAGFLSRDDFSETADSFTACDGVLATKRFVFGREKIASLRDEISSNPKSQLRDATRVEAVMAFIWKKLIDVAKEKNPDIETTSSDAYLSVNLRPRGGAHIPEQVFGNCFLIPRASCSISGGGGKEFGQSHHLGHLIRKAIKKIDGDHIKQVQLDFGEYLRQCEESFEHTKEGTSGFYVTSWTRFPVYEVDFGWGKPIRVSTATQYRHLVILMSTPCGEGIEALITLLEDEMKMFERCCEL